jgi:hypothetical protein
MSNFNELLKIGNDHETEAIKRIEYNLISRL